MVMALFGSVMAGSSWAAGRMASRRARASRLMPPAPRETRQTVNVAKHMYMCFFLWQLCRCCSRFFFYFVALMLGTHHCSGYHTEISGTPHGSTPRFDLKHFIGKWDVFRRGDRQEWPFETVQSSVFKQGMPVGQGVAWSTDQKKAWLMKDGEASKKLKDYAAAWAESRGGMPRAQEAAGGWFQGPARSASRTSAFFLSVLERASFWGDFGVCVGLSGLT